MFQRNKQIPLIDQIIILTPHTRISFLANKEYYKRKWSRLAHCHCFSNLINTLPILVDEYPIYFYIFNWLRSWKDHKRNEKNIFFHTNL